MNILTTLHNFAVRTVDPNQVGIPKVRADDAQFNNLVNGAFLLAGAIAVLFVIIGGIKYIMSEGEPGKTEQAKNTVIYAAVGLAVTALAYTLVRVVIEVAQ